MTSNLDMQKFALSLREKSKELQEYARRAMDSDQKISLVTARLVLSSIAASILENMVEEKDDGSTKGTDIQV